MKILWISYYFYPMSGVGPNKNTLLVEELLKKGYNIKVITTVPNKWNFNISTLIKEKKEFNLITIPSIDNQLAIKKFLDTKIKNPFPKKGKRSFSSKELIKNLLNFIDYQHSWYVMWFLNRSKYLKEIEKFSPDLLYVSAPPFSSILIGKDIKERLNIPAILEYRDLWTGSQHYKKLNFIRKYEYKLEKSFINNFEYILFATEGIRKKFLKIFKIDKENTDILYNFFNKLNLKNPYMENDCIYFAYVGTLLNKYDYSCFLSGLRVLKRKNISFKVFIFSGNHDIIKFILDNSFKDLKEYFYFDYESNIDKLSEKLLKIDIFVNFLLNFKYEGAVASKNFYYLSFNKPVFVFGNYEIKEVKEVLKYNYFFINNKDKFVKLVENYKKGKLNYGNSVDYIKSHSLLSRVNKLENIFHKVLRK